MKILCCGDRHWSSYDIIKRELKKFDDETIIIEGCAEGADKISGFIGKILGFKILKYPADWKKYGKGAGVIRNSQMLDEGKPDLVLAFHNNIKNSKGTKDTVTKAKKMGIEVIIINE